MTTASPGRPDGDEDLGLTIMVIPESGGESRSFRVSGQLARSYRRLGLVAAVMMVVLVGSWVVLALRASRVGGLEAEVARLAEDNRRVSDLARELETLEEAYAQIRGLFGSGPTGADELWLPPGTGRIGASAPSAPDADAAPTEWPLGERGFVTRTPMTGGTVDEDHPGIDIAVPSGVYVRAAGRGTVTETGSDEIYGNYVVLDHGDGYQTLYGHASVLLTSDGDTVREREVIALTGSTGRSTAPHLHFEIMREGQPIDPMSLVSQP